MDEPKPTLEETRIVQHLALSDCEHQWVSKHQPDFPEPIYWVGVCSLCGRIDGQMLADQLPASARA